MVSPFVENSIVVKMSICKTMFQQFKVSRSPSAINEKHFKQTNQQFIGFEYIS